MNVVTVKKSIRSGKFKILHNYLQIGCELSDKQLAYKVAKDVARIAGVANICIEGATVEVMNA